MCLHVILHSEYPAPKAIASNVHRIIVVLYIVIKGWWLAVSGIGFLGQPDREDDPVRFCLVGP